MSLEAALKENTEAIQALTKLLSSGIISAPTPLPPPGGIITLPQPAAEPKAEPKPKAEAKPKAEKPKADVIAQEIPYTAISTAITDLIAAGKRDKAVAILSAFGVANGKSLKPEQYPDALAQFKAALAA